MLSIIEAAGWPIWLIIITYVIALAIIGERFWSLRTSLVAPRGMLPATMHVTTPIKKRSTENSTRSCVSRHPMFSRMPASSAVSR